MEKLLFEIGTEEIPAKFMPAILAQLKDLAAAKMQELRIPFEDITVYGTPRRMAFIASGVAETQADVVVEAKGPSVKIAYVSGAPSKAAQGFARGQGVDVNDLVVRDNYVYAVKHLAGQPVVELLPGLLMDILTSLSFPKTMRWADYDFRFVRPIRWLVALFGDQIVPVEICGVKSGKFSMGHRFMQQSLKAAAESQGLISAALTKMGNKVYSALAGVKGAVEIPTAGDYKKVMYDNFVMVDQDERRALILQQIKDLAAQNGGEAEINEDLLEEVNYLVEWPTALCGKFEEKHREEDSDHRHQSEIREHRSRQQQSLIVDRNPDAAEKCRKTRADRKEECPCPAQMLFPALFEWRSGHIPELFAEQFGELIEPLARKNQNRGDDERILKPHIQHEIRFGENQYSSGEKQRVQRRNIKQHRTAQTPEPDHPERPHRRSIRSGRERVKQQCSGQSEIPKSQRQRTQKDQQHRRQHRDVHARNRIEMDRPGFDEPRTAGGIDTARSAEEKCGGQIADSFVFHPAERALEQPVAHDADTSDHA